MEMAAQLQQIIRAIPFPAGPAERLWPLETGNEEAQTMVSIYLFMALRSSLCHMQTVVKTILHSWIEKLPMIVITEGLIFQSHLIF